MSRDARAKNVLQSHAGLPRSEGYIKVFRRPAGSNSSLQEAGPLVLNRRCRCR